MLNDTVKKRITGVDTCKTWRTQKNKCYNGLHMKRVTEVNQVTGVILIEQLLSTWILHGNMCVSRGNEQK